MIRDHVSEAGIGVTCLDIEVRNPRTHIDKGKALYTDYEIEVKTNHACFPLLHSKTRRRYSEFVWLRDRLGLHDVMMVSAPSLPRKQLIGRFKENFVRDREEGLQRFLNKLVEVNVFLQEPSLQLFLQTNLKSDDMDHYIKTRTSGAIKSLILMLHNKQLKKRERKMTISNPISHDFPLTKKSQRKRFGGRGWSSQYGDGYYTFPLHCNDDLINLDDTGIRQRSTTVSAGALPGGRLTLPTIPGSMEMLSSQGSEYTTEEEMDYDVDHPLSASWHGTSSDQIDFILEDYEIIPLNSITKIQDESRSEASELGYLDLTTTTDSLCATSGEQLTFDY